MLLDVALLGESMSNKEYSTNMRVIQEIVTAIANIFTDEGIYDVIINRSDEFVHVYGILWIKTGNLNLLNLNELKGIPFLVKTE